MLLASIGVTNDELLQISMADRRDDAAIGSELRTESAVDLRRGRRDEDAVIRRQRWVSERSVVVHDTHVGEAELRQPLARGLGERGVTLDRDDFPREERQHGGLI